MASLAPLNCYWCGQMLAEPCAHIRTGREPITNARAHRYLVERANMVDNDYRPFLGFAAEDIQGGDGVVWDGKIGKFRRYA